LQRFIADPPHYLGECRKVVHQRRRRLAGNPDERSFILEATAGDEADGGLVGRQFTAAYGFGHARERNRACRFCEDSLLPR
jgi:hypothetical protein